ncbi:MAG TPA: translocation/assembly module TamB domain-containing protein [Gemmatimonadales bacterium]|nr:translocation/assembly module TamB domain-containing protein [Gemmatimonadales bacterium]
MRRRIARFFFVFLLGTVAMVLGVVTSMTLTPPGRNLLARTVSRGLDRIIIGQVKVGAISGSFIYDLAIEDLVVRDTSGALLADLPRVRVTYRLPNLLAGQVLLSSVTLDHPTLQLIKLRNGRMNFEEVLGLKKGKGTGPGPLIDFYKVKVTGGTLRIALPWNPDRSLRTVAQRDSALEAERAKPGRVVEEGGDGLRKVILLSDLDARFARLRIATPDKLPFTVDIDSLATRVSDPALTLTDAVGRVRLHGDSAIFSLSRGSLPDTRFSGGGAVTWPHDTTLFDFQVISPHVNLDDLHWVSPDFPAMTGSGVLAAKSETGARTAYDIRDLHLRNGEQRIDGALVAITDRKRGLGFRDMNVTLRNLDLDAARAYVDSLPFFGTLSGTVAGAGFLDAMDVTLDWAFADARVPGRPVTTIAGNGIVGSTRDSGLTFTNFVVRRSDVDLRTVRLLAPAVIIEGRLAAAGTLDGPLRNVTFRGTARQQDGDRPPSTANGTVYLDTRGESLRLATDVVFDPLSFEGIRRAFPSLKTRGDLTGRFRSEGTLSRLAVDADLTGDLGEVQAEGFVTVLPPRWGADGLRLRFSRLDLATLTGRALSTSLAGELRATGVIDTLRAPEGDLEVALTRSRVREWTIDSLFGRGSVHDSVIRVDTAYAEWQGARASGGGTLGWRAPRDGRMRFDFAADSLIGFDSLLLAMTQQKRDTSADARPLGGRAEGHVELAGSLDSLLADGAAAVEAFEWQRIRSPRITGAGTWIGGRRPRVTARVASDSIRVQQWVLRRTAGAVSGFADSLGWSAGTDLGDASRFDGSGGWYAQGDARILRIDTLLAKLAVRRYRLDEPVSIALTDSAPSVTPLQLRSLDGSSTLLTAGRVPGTAPGDLQLQLLGLDVHDVYGLLQRDTSGVSGEIELDLQVGGTSAAPTFRGIARLADGRFGDFQSPFVQGVLNYEQRRLDANLDLWRTGENLLQVEAHLPLDLAFTGAEKRQIDGPLSVRAHTDSVSLGLLEAITPAVNHVGGTLKADVQVGGTWAEPRLAGEIDIANGSMSLPGLGIRFGAVRGGATLEGDSVRLRDVVLTSGGGKLNAGGSVRLENLSHPILNLTFRADQFRAIDVRSFLTLVGTGDLELRGPVFGATLTGSLLANSGVLYFADLVNKRIIDLEDPSIADLVDTTLIRRENLGAKFQNRFLDSLRIDDLRVEMGSDVWLRSAEANIQLEGRVRVSKQGQTYNPTGTLNAPRGTYTLKIGPVTRDFTVNRGQVTYTGDLNAGLDIAAQHTVRSIRGDEIPIVASIAGTLYQPKLTLGSTIRPPISETDLISYLITGYPANEATLLGQGSALQTGLSYFSSALSSELERALIQDIGVPIDLIEIRPGVSSSPSGAGSLTQLAAGWQIGKKTFLTFNAGFCPDFSQLSYKNLGASLEFRFSREWKLQTAVEPTIQSCSSFGTANRFANTSLYQVGFDILWEREF